MVKTAVLVSGGGKNLQSLIDAGVFGELPQCELTAVIASNPESYAITRARISGIPCYIVDRSLFPNPTAYGFALLDKLRDLDIGLVVLAGYGCELTQPIFSHFGGRIIDTWPSLMPAFTEAELSGLEIQRAQLASGIKLSGATAYFATEKPHSGPIIVQRAVAVHEGDTPFELQKRVLEEGENIILPRAVSLFCEGKLKIENGVVHIAGPAETASGPATE